MVQVVWPKQLKFQNSEFWNLKHNSKIKKQHTQKMTTELPKSRVAPHDLRDEEVVRITINNHSNILSKF
jgi:hypothetical protein